MARRYGGQSYRGRQGGGSSFLKGLVVFLAVLLALAVGLVIYMGRYVEYTDEGTQLRPPWLQEQEAPSASPDLSDLIIGDGQEQDGGERHSEDRPDSAPAPDLQVLRVQEVSASSVVKGTAAGQCAKAGADALMVQVKDHEGNLAWHSEAELAQEEMNGDPAFNAAVQALARSGELHLTARLTGFQDLWTSVYDRETAILGKSGKLWYDGAGYSWMSVSAEPARTYLTGLCLELAEMGFDEILLEHAAYPDQGRVRNIAVGSLYPETGKDLVAAGWLRGLSRALEEAGAVLSVQPTESAPDDGTASGLTPEALCGLSGRVWLPKKADPSVWVEVLAGAGLSDAGRRVVAWEPVPEESGWQGSILLSGGAKS